MDFNIKIETFENDEYKIVDYVPHPKQKEFHLNLNTNRYNIFRKSRGVGGTTTVAVESVLRLGHIYNYSIGYVPATYTGGVHFINRVRNLYENQEYIPTPINKNSRNKLQLNNGSQLMMVLTPDNLVGQRFDWIIFDDCFISKDVKHILDISRRMDGERTLLATPPKGNNAFKRYYYGAITNLNEYIPTDYLWYDHPTYAKDIEWVRGNVRIPHDDSNITVQRLLEFGFHRESQTYTRHLKMFGLDVDNEDMENFDSYATSTY